MEMFKKGDKFIHFTKYGGINKGEVEGLHSTTVWDFNNLCRYESLSIFTTEGVRLNLDGTDGRIYKIDSEMVKDHARQFEKMMKKASDKKNRPSIEIIHHLDEDKKT